METKLACFGHNCGATHIAQEFATYLGCSPTDWTVCTSNSFAKILACMYTYDLEDVIKKFTTYTDANNKSNYNLEFDIWAPHFLLPVSKENSGNRYGYNSQDHTLEKIKRRFVRMNNVLKNERVRLIFLYVGSCGAVKEEKGLDEEPYAGLIKVFKLLQLFRSKDTFRIAYVDAGFDESKVEELKKYNIDYIKGDRVTNERFWILPCANKVKKFYGIK